MHRLETIRRTSARCSGLGKPASYLLGRRCGKSCGTVSIIFRLRTRHPPSHATLMDKLDAHSRKFRTPKISMNLFCALSRGTSFHLSPRRHVHAGITLFQDAAVSLSSSQSFQAKGDGCPSPWLFSTALIFQKQSIPPTLGSCLQGANNMVLTSDPAQLTYQQGHLRDDKAPQTIAAQSTCLALACISVILRYAARKLSTTRIAIDDHLIFLALVG